MAEAADGHAIQWLGTGATGRPKQLSIYLHPACVLTFTLHLYRDLHEIAGRDHRRVAWEPSPLGEPSS